MTKNSFLTVAGITALLAAFLVGRFTTPDGLLRRLDPKGEPVLKFAGGTITSADLAQAPRGGLTRPAVEQMGKTAFLALEAERIGLHHTPDFVRRYREELAQLYIQKQFEEPFQKQLPTEQDVRKLFDEHRAQLGRPERVRLAHIAFLAPASDPGARALKRGAAQKALAEVRRGKDEYAFGRLAMKVSEDTRSRIAAGELPFMTREELGARLGPEAVEVAFALQPGRVADKVIETERGFQIVKLLAHEAAREPSYEELKDAIRTRLTADRRAEAFKKFMDELWKKAGAKIDDKALAKLASAKGAVSAK